MLKKIQIPPGIHKESTQYAAAGQWYDSNNIRFREGYAEMIGGWTRDSMYELQGIGREAFSSRDYSGNLYQFIGTDWKYYVITGTSAVDITPVRETATLGSGPFTVTADNPNILVTDAGHGLAVNDWVVFTGATAVSLTTATGTIDADNLNQVHGFQVSEIVSTSEYRFYLVDWSTGTEIVPVGGGSGGGTPAYYYKVTSGLSVDAFGQGWGTGLWGGEGMPTAYVLDGSSAVTGGGSSSTTATITPDSASDLPATSDSVYLIGLSGTVSGVDLEILNDNWWPVVSVSSPSFNVTIPYEFSGTASGGGASASFYKMVTATGVVTGATRGWDENSDQSVLVGTTRRVYIDNYGEDLMFSNSGGPIFYWDVSASSSAGIPTGTEAAVAKELIDFDGSIEPPVFVDSFLVSKRDGHCVALGCNDVGNTSTLNALLVRWSDQNNPFDWLPVPNNTSGGQVLRLGSKILGGVSTKDEVVIFTDAAVYSMRFVGPPDVFSFNLITSGVEIISGRTAVNASNAVFFMGREGFYVYTGSVSPLPCTVANYVFEDFNFGQKDKCFGGLNSAFSEVIWFYPSADSFEPNRWVSFNYADSVWAVGKYDMSAFSASVGSSTSNCRTSWRDSVVFSNPMSTFIKNYAESTVSATAYVIPLQEQSAVMLHETNTGLPEFVEAFIESGEVEISDGENFVFYSRVIPDLQLLSVDTDASNESVLLEFKEKDYPEQDAPFRTRVEEFTGFLTAFVQLSLSYLPIVYPGNSPNELITFTDGSATYQTFGSVGRDVAGAVSIEKTTNLGVAEGFIQINQSAARDIGSTFLGWSGTPELGKVTVTYQTSGQMVKVEFSGGNQISSPTQMSSVIRGRARSVALKVSSNLPSQQWRLGDIRIDVQPDGRR